MPSPPVKPDFRSTLRSSAGPAALVLKVLVGKSHESLALSDLSFQFNKRPAMSRSSHALNSQMRFASHLEN